MIFLVRTDNSKDTGDAMQSISHSIANLFCRTSKKSLCGFEYAILMLASGAGLMDKFEKFRIKPTVQAGGLHPWVNYLAWITR